ncbi:restriction endonuclease subunit S [Methanobrevibacter smithii]|uniref:restriction endonuclease subunit S n=1 Tax=Methanobrevibacter smithii TaxID=2173 RepID=UPI0037DD7A9D
MSEEKLVPKLRFSGFDDEWNQYYLKDVIQDFINGQTPSRNVDSFWNGDVNWVSSGELNYNYITSTIEQITAEGKNNTNLKLLSPGTFLIAITGLEAPGTRGSCAILGIEATTNQSCMALLPKEDKIITKFLYYWYLKVGETYGIKYTQGTKQQSYNKELLEKLPITIPDIREQNKISEFLSVLNHKIELLEQKYQYYQEFKKYLMQQIFTQKLRFNFNDTWKTVKIKDIFDERSEKGFLDLELLSVTLNDGVIKRSEIESKDNSNENKSNYKHVLPGDIVYNSMRMWQGASGVSPYEGIVSPAYTILIPKNVYSKYFGYYFKTNEMVYQFKKYSQGLTSDTWNLKYPLISEIKIKIPSIEEQKEITNVFEIMDEKIKILQNNIDELTTFKKGLLQQMFV